MKTLSFAVLLLFLGIQTASAVTEEQLPVACDSTRKILEQIKKKDFRPVMMGEVDGVQTIVFVNPENDMVIGITVEQQGKSMTCIWVAGEKNTMIFDRPQKQKEIDKDL